MADLNKFKTTDGLTAAQFNAEPGRLSGIQVIATGTNNSGQTGDASNIGRIEITRNGQPRINRNAQKFVDMNDIRGGTNIFESVDDGTFRAGFFIPFYEKGHPNAWNITDDEELNVRFIPGDDGTVFNDLELKFEQEMVALEERYDYFILGNDVSENSARQAKGYTLNRENVTALYLDDVDDIVNLLSVENNRGNVISTTDWDSLLNYTLRNNRVEDASFDIVEIENHTPGVPGSTVNRNNKLVLTTSGAGDVDVTVCSIMWNS